MLFDSLLQWRENKSMSVLLYTEFIARWEIIYDLLSALRLSKIFCKILSVANCCFIILQLPVKIFCSEMSVISSSQTDFKWRYLQHFYRRNNFEECETFNSMQFVVTQIPRNNKINQSASYIYTRILDHGYIGHLQSF